MVLALRIPPLIVWLFFAGLSYILPSSLNLTTYDVPIGVGILVLMLGFGLALVGVFAFRKAKTSSNPLDPRKASHIVDSGVYGHTRNPMYLGMAIGLVGFCLLIGALISLVVVVFFCWYLNEFQIKPEEHILEEKFGQDFLDYKNKVRRWL